MKFFIYLQSLGGAAKRTCETKQSNDLPVCLHCVPERLYSRSELFPGVVELLIYTDTIAQKAIKVIDF